MADDRRDERGIESAAEIGPDRDIRAQSDPRGVDEQIPELLHGFLERGVARGAKLETPVGMDLKLIASDACPMSGRQLFDTFEGGSRGERAPERENLIEGAGGNGRRDLGMRQQTLDFRTKHDASGQLAVEQRPDPESIPGEKQCLAISIPDGDGELTIEVLKALRTVLLIQMQNHLGIGPGPELMPPGLESGAEFDVIEHLAIEDDPQGFVLVGDRLLTRAEIDDAQARVAQGDVRIGVHTELIGTAMTNHRQCVFGTLGQVARRGVRSAEFTHDATHQARSFLETLPEEVMGSVSRNSMCLGTMKSSRRALQWARTSLSVRVRP